MRVIDYFQEEDPAQWLQQIALCEWRAAAFLNELLKTKRFHEVLGAGTLYLLACSDELVSFLTLTQRDCIDDESLLPWIGFVYTTPDYRGHRYAGKLINHAVKEAGRQGAERVWICSDHVGLYEKYGFTYLGNRLSIYGEDSRVYYRLTGRRYQEEE